MQIYNTMTRKKEALIPLKPGEISMYVCGPTVYNYFHIGNARPFVVFDTLRRYLEHRGYQVKFIQNFTDIDDKLIRKANEEGCTVQEIADRYIREYYVDADALGVERATCRSSTWSRPSSTKGTPMPRTMGTYTFPCAPSPAMGSCPASPSTTWKAAPASIPRSKSGTPWTLPCGRAPSPESPPGPPPGAWAGPAGTSSAAP